MTGGFDVPVKIEEQEMKKKSGKARSFCVFRRF